MPGAAPRRPASPIGRRRQQQLRPPAAASASAQGAPQAAAALTAAGSVVLIGLRGAGKTTAGAALAAALQRPFVDADAALVEAAGEPIAALLARDEGAFRRLEAEVLARLLAAPGSVISTGGGVVERPESRERLRASPVVIYLAAPPEVLAGRVRLDEGSARPPLASGGPLAEARALHARRDAWYREVAGARVDASAPLAEVVASLTAAVRALEGSAGPP